MSNETNKYTRIASGWVKNSASGVEYVSCKGGDSLAGLTLQIKDNKTGEVTDIESFAGFFNKDKKNPNEPDLRFVFTPKQ